MKHAKKSKKTKRKMKHDRKTKRRIKKSTRIIKQQYPPGTQNIFKEFPTNNDVTENGKEPNYPKGGRGFEGGPGVPPIIKGGEKQNRDVVNDILNRGKWVEEEDRLESVDPDIYDFVESQVDTTKAQREAMIVDGIPVNKILRSYRYNFSSVNGGLRADNVDESIQPIVDGLISIFNNPICPRFNKTTILFRGGSTDFEYQQVVVRRETLQKSFISTTKKMNTLFGIIPNVMMLPNRRLKEQPIAINMLLVDPDIPYLDLYNEVEGVRDIDRQQDEILLPLGLRYEYAASSSYTTKDEYTGEDVVNPVHIFYVHQN